MKKILMLSFLLGLSILVRAQSYSGVIESEVVKSFDLTEGKETIVINAEKANIYLKSWDKNKIEVRLKKVSQNKNEGAARKEISYMKFNVVKEKKKVKLKNFIALDPNVKKVTSHLQFVYEIMVPQDVDLEIINYFGNVHVTNISGDVKCKTKYGDLNLDNVSGRLFIDLNFGKVNANHVNVTGTVISNKGQLAFNDVAGDYTINMKYGKLELQAAKELEQLAIQSKSADITLIPNCIEYDLEIANQYGELLVSNEACVSGTDLEIIKTSPAFKQLNHRSPSDRSIKINATYGDVNIRYN